MATYNRKVLAHSRKVITSSMGSTKPHYSIETMFQSPIKELRRQLNEDVSTGLTSPLFNIDGRSSTHHEHDFLKFKDRFFNLANLQDVSEVKSTPTVFVSTSKPSAAIDRLHKKRKTNHEDAMKYMKEKLTACYAACENEFRNYSISVKIQINKFRIEIEEVKDKLRKINLMDLNYEDCDIAWKKVNVIIENEKQIIDRFYNRILNIEKKRLESTKSILQEYYKIFHNISFWLPYEIQVYLENEILNYNIAVLGNHRTYADLHLQMRLLADAVEIRFKDWIQELKTDLRAMNIYRNS